MDEASKKGVKGRVKNTKR